MHQDSFPDGFYLVDSGGASYFTRTVLVLRQGQLFGLGPFGGIYEGDYTFDPGRKLTTFTGHVTLPPDTPLVTGGKTGAEGLRAPIVSEAKFVAGVPSRCSFSLGGKSVDLSIRFVRPLPQ